MDPFDPQWFSADYQTARARFRALVTEMGGTHTALPLAAKGPGDGDLSIDIGWFGPARPRNVILHCSGTHGVEGFAGSAIQLSLMKHRLHGVPSADAIVYVHVVNPYGMAWQRRVNERNVDLNRNFLGDAEPYAGASDGYRRLDPTLNPTTAPSAMPDFFLLRSGIKILRYGYNALKQAVTEGQYVFPKGLFYGGAELEEGPRRYLEWASARLGECERVIGIDVHTGLGKYGEDTLLVEAGVGDPLYETLRAALGDRVMPWDPAQSVAYEIRGGHGAGVARCLAGAQVEFITQEFGTVAPLKVLYALRQENRWHHYGGGGLDHSTKRQIMEAFGPAGPRWRRRVLTRGHALMAQCCARLQG